MKTLPKLISDYNKAAVYEVNIQNTITFLHNTTEQLEFEI